MSSRTRVTSSEVTEVIALMEPRPSKRMPRSGLRRQGRLAGLRDVRLPATLGQSVLRALPERTNPELEGFVEPLPPLPDNLPLELRSVLNCIHANLFDPLLNVQYVRFSCGLLDNNVSCRFRHQTGMSIRDYIEALRMQAAVVLLTSSGYSAFEVAQAVGYSHPQTFYRAFRRRYRRTPGACRKPSP